MTEDDCLLWLSCIPNLTLKRQKDLISVFGSAYDIWVAPEKLILSINGIPKNVLENIISYRNSKKFIAYEKMMRQSKVFFISYKSDLYPELLKQISDYPLGLYIKGDLPDISLLKISMVGSRKYTEYGAYIAKKIACDLAARDIVIVSGMARGIDSVVHKAAINSNGKTIAVLGCGIDICYPPENARLRENIIHNGCLISEFPLGTKPIVRNFPMRNRIISGISKALIVIEASEKSGTLITAGHALEQGREVMAIPGMVNSNFSRGTNYLIKNGASLVTSFQDILDIIGDNHYCKNFSNDINENFSNYNISLENNEKLICDVIGFDEKSFDFIANHVDLPVSKISSCLIMLEIKGIIKKLPGSKYIRT